MLWTLIGLSTCSLILTAWLIWWMWRHATETRRRLQLIDAGMESLPQAVIRGVQSVLEDSRRREQEEQDKLPIGTFLPDDAGVQEMERQFRSADDRFIPAQHPIRYSSRPSSPSETRSAPAPSKPPGKRSGIA
jgi:hypothetical protein